MRILLVTTYFEPDSGAAAVRLSRLAHLLHARGHQVTVLAAMPHYPKGEIAEGYRGKFAQREDRDGIQVIRTWLYTTTSSRISRKLISQMTFMLTAGFRGLGMKRSDVILIEAQPIFTSVAGVLVSKMKRVPYVLNVSDLWPDHLLSVGALTEDHPIYRYARLLVNRMYRGASAITTLSPAWAKAIRGYIGERHAQKIQVIYNGVDLVRFKPEIESAAFGSKYHLPDTKLVTFIGTFATQYDLDSMLTVTEYFSHREDVLFVFIGAGSQAEAFQMRLNSGHYPNVRLIAWIDHSEIPAAWGASYLTYWMMRDQPLYRGTIPAKLYEALACGVPILAAMEGIAAEIIVQSGGGVCVSCGDIEGLSKEITHLINNPADRTRYAQAARAYAESHFDPELVIDAYEAVLLNATK